MAQKRIARCKILKFFILKTTKNSNLFFKFENKEKKTRRYI